ncbi:MAG: FAD-linked oxidase C-terminal domain-containing protein [Longimicrobiales bacterium]
MIDAALASELRSILGDDGVITDPGALLVYESDGLTAYRCLPGAVLLPRTTDDVCDVMRALHKAGVAFVPRGAGTGLSGGALALNEAVVVSTARMNQILEVDPANRLARVQPAVINVHLTAAAAPYGLYYAPDPSSQTVCTIGGNVGENAGGPHCLKYGVTLNHIAGVTVVLSDGEVIRLGGAGREEDGLDLLGLFIGSEGTLGMATEIEVKLERSAEAVRTMLATFDTIDAATRAVSAIIAEGMLPAALEMVDRNAILAIEASAYAAGLPTDIGAALVIEFDGPAAALDEDVQRARTICEREHAIEVRVARDEPERQKLWYARKKAFGAMGRLAPDLLIQDAVVPRSRLPQVLAQVYEIAARYDLHLCNMFHAGDGNLHPTIVFDRRDPDQLDRVERASREMMHACVTAGGTITGEHGVGIDKQQYMELVFSDPAMSLMCDVRRVFDPSGRANPGKLLPTRVCREWAGPATRRVENPT